MNSFGRNECEPAADENFGPRVASCARLFDFTLLFEQAILSTVPSVIFLLLATWRLKCLYLSNRKTRLSWLSFAKPTMTLALITTQLMLLVYYTQPATVRTEFSIPATVLSLIAAVTILPLSYLEQRRSVRPSTLLISYLAFATILDLPQSRTLYLLPRQYHLACTFSAAMAAKVLLLTFEAWNKRRYLLEKYKSLAVETTSGILSRSLFLWMNNLFKRGYSKAIFFDDLDPIDSDLGSARLHKKIQNVWKHQDRSVRAPLLRSLWKALRWSILSPVPARVCYAGFQFAQPYLIQRATEYLTEPNDLLEDDIGYGLIGATACIYLGIAISTALFQHQLYRHITIVRGSLVSLIYTESLFIEDRMDDPSAAITLMSTDVDRICQSLILLHDLWARPLELAVGISLLALQIGWVCVMPVAVVVISALFDSRVTVSIGGKVKIWSDAVQQRISMTADILSSMKSVKMLGLARPISKLMQDERLHELKLQAKFRWSTIWLNTLGNVPPALAPAVTFITYAIKAHVDGSKSLNTSQVFTSLALINLVSTPASELLAAFPSTASCLGCVKRIQNHLTNLRRQDRRIFDQGQEKCLEKMTETKQSVEQNAVCLNKVDISMDDGAHSLLEDVNLDFRQNSFTMLVGPSGSGKSTLLRAMVSEINYIGNISLGVSRIAYCPQLPWVFTGTIRQNICGLNTDSIDEHWYFSVLHSCALDAVLPTLPHGDYTRVEGQSSSLSGGQKQRIVLARVLYQRPQLLLLDDVLSALDVKTEVQIISRLFGANGLLSQLGTTVILATHTHRWEALADSVVTLDRNGKATQRYKSRQFEQAFYLDSSISSEATNSNPSGSHEIKQAESRSSQDKLPRTESARHGSLGDYSFYIKTVRWPVLLLFVSAAGAQTVCYYVSQETLNWWTADNGSNEAKWLPLYLAMAIGNAVMYGCTAWTVFLRLVPQSAANLHKLLVDVVMCAPYSFFTGSDIGTILNRFSQDMTLVESQLPTGLLCTLIYFFWTLGSLALISLGSSWMALTIPAVFVALYCVQRVYLRTSRRLRVIELELRSPIYSQFMETLKGLSTIRTLGWEDQFTNSIFKKLDDSQIPYYLLFCAQRWLQLVLDLVVAALAIVVMTMAVQLRDTTSPSSLGLSLNNILGFNQILAILLQYWTQLEVSLGAITRTKEFSLTTPAEIEPVVHKSVHKSWPNGGQIEIRDVSVHYARNKAVLSNVSLSVNPGERVGLCGRSGSGKSSLLSVILRLVEPSTGLITIDGVDLADVDHKTIRERIISIPQDPFLIMQRTVRFNLDPQAAHDDISMINALSKVSLWSLLEKRGGLDMTFTSEILSQGQKQLFSLARALIQKEWAAVDRQVVGGVVLLDEATSNIDKTADTLIQRIIRDEFSTYTIIVVAHRLDTILDSDRIAVLDSGRLVEFDSPRALLSKDSAFSALYNSGEMEGL